MIDERLKSIAEMVDRQGTLLDVGTDHGYLPVYLVKSGKIKAAIASDVSRGSLAKAAQEVAKQKLESSIETRLGSGLEVIGENDKIDTIVIAGMGGILISELIDKRLDYIRKNSIDLIVQPVQSPESVRRYFHENGFEITAEKLAKADGRIYHIIKAKAGSRGSEQAAYVRDDIVFELGELIMSDAGSESKALLREMIGYKLKEQHKIKAKLEITESGNIGERYKEVLRKIESLDEVLRKLD